MKYRVKTLVLTGATVVVVGAVAVSAQASSCTVDDPFCFDRSASHTPETLTKITMPDIAVPVWLDQPTTQENGDIR